jgi:hypothetical protein
VPPNEFKIVTRGVFGAGGILQACYRADRQLRRDMGQALRPVGERVRADAAARIAAKSARSAAGYRVRVRQRGVAVEQSLRKTTGKHPQWGGYQMTHALLPARRDNYDETVRALVEATDRICDLWEEQGPSTGL